MDDGQPFWSHMVLLLPLLGAAVGWYVSARLAVSALATQPGATIRRAIGHCIPVLFVTMTAILRHEPQIAIGVIFGSCVATLSLVLGVMTFTSPPTQIAPDARRKWGFALPATMLVFLAGYQSKFTMLHAGVLLLEAVVILLVWTGARSADMQAETCTPNDSIGVQASACMSWSWKSSLLAVLFLVAAVVIALFSGWIAVSGATKFLANSTLPSMSIIAALLLGPALVIPMIGADSFLSQHGHYTDAVSSQVAFVILNLCVLLPLVIMGWYVQAAMPITSAAHLWSRMNDLQTTSPLNFPLIVWRVDSVMLLVLSFALLPISLGRWLPRRAEGIVLIALYAVYMLLWRWGSEIG